MRDSAPSMSAPGQIPSLHRCPLQDRFSTESGNPPAVLLCRTSATTGLMLRNKEHHSKISSARPDSGNGIVTPSAWAVFMLMYSSTLVTCWTGRSPGFSPLSMRPV